ncbi:DUF3365 domain-containing protein [Geomonas nitrogeniifigens]|uniref:DUF3365 domain-containing protein n=1 Tax=Geomonas diazotrophica TaxID=2843197 RepID=A0ABX8JKT2_9BACT|nr:DUF3365 domain-containing protein [Geomonas nitrogeniifigens]QWV97721.1 DUF3365 domain-containing protein [Geomonas nitrogeniifigens]QXE86858.1 DUF3365 domain-containing protein [Geomonas nitrogeniifigens]
MLNFSAKRAFVLLYLASYLIVAVAIVLTVNHQQREAALDEAREKARLILDSKLAVHSYFSKQLKPKLFQLTDRYRPGEYFDPVWMSSTYAVREIDRYNNAFSNSNYYYKECAVNARSPLNEADDVERAFLGELKRNSSIDVRSEIRLFSGKPFFVVMRRGESMEKDCLRCHSVPQRAPADLVHEYGPLRSFNRHEGDLVSAVSIRIPLEKAYADANRLSFQLSVLLLAILGGASLLQFLLMEGVLLNPLAALRDRTDAILRDESRLGQDIPQLSRARELVELTGTFNDLSRHLRAEKEGLVGQVRQRTAELQELNQTLEQDVAQRKAVQAELAAKVEQLEAALAKVRILEGVIPICSYCKKIRNDEESWQQMEQYISEHTDAMFSHGICPSCFDEQCKVVKRREEDEE